MKPIRYLLTVLIVFHTLSNVYSQNFYTLSGYIRDAANGEGLIGANIYVSGIQNGVNTNVYGFYSIKLPEGEHTLTITYVGYIKQTRTIVLDKNLTIDFELKEDSKILDEVLVMGERPDENIKSTEISVNKVEMKTIRKMPALLGEIDLIRSILFLPGVSSVGEGSSGFNVRGGAIDQNLVLLDEAPVYNSSHLLGFFSIFNPDVVKDVKLIKGGIPANYGGRVSSILDVRMKEGNNKKTQFSGGIGTIFSRLTLESPIVKDKGSFVLALRRSYIDLLAKPFLNKSLRKVKFYFYDFTAKANYTIDPKNTIFLSGYFGRDVFGERFGFDWGNSTATFRWNHIFNQKLFLNNTVYYSNYDYAIDFSSSDDDTGDKFRWESNIKNFSIKPDFTWYINPENTLTFGGQSIYYRFEPGKANIVSGGEEQIMGMDSKFGLESSLYAGMEQKLAGWLTLNYGIRYSTYQYFSKYSYLFDDNVSPAERKPLKETISHESNEIVQSYQNWEPRLAVNLGLNKSTSLKIGYNRLSQYLHLLSNTSASSPLDVWTPSSNNIKPQISDQIAVGVFKNFKTNIYESSVELYYKKLQNQIDYTRNADLLLNPYVEGDLLSGKGRAYGAEFFLKKNKGAFNGWISYTLSRSERKVAGLNNDKWFLSRIDKLHNLSVVSIYDINNRWDVGATFTYMTGTPATFPNSKYQWQGIVIPHNYYDERNSYRIPPTHRLDLSATRKNKHALFKKGESEWVFSVYNVYNRRNPFSVYVRQNQSNPSQTEAVQYSIFASTVPAVTYNFKF